MHEQGLQNRKRVKALPLLVGAAVLIMSCIILLALVGFISVQQAQNEPFLVSGYSPRGANLEWYSLSPAQVDTVTAYGYPDSFLILYFDQVQPDGTQSAMREETWSYHTSGYAIVFRNGEIYTKSTDEPVKIDGLYSTNYRPEMFSEGMGLDEILAACGQDTFLEVPVEDELVENSRLYYIQGLAFGVKDGRLLYLETLPLVEEGDQS